MLANHIRMFQRLRRDYKLGGAPHKPILLLAILELVERGEITSPKIEPTGELILAFKAIWSKLVITSHSPNFALPFYHLKSEPFWTLMTFDQKTIPLTSSNSIKSLSGLRESVAYALMDAEMFNNCLKSLEREVLRQTLLETYFNSTKQFFRANLYQNLLSEYEGSILEEPIHLYDQKNLTNTNEEFVEEERLIRGSVFKRIVPLQYGYQCAITRMQASSTVSSVQLVDACHIVPIAEAGIDHISNGISLSPTLHRAFDRGLITITSNYHVRVSPHLNEAAGPYSLKQYEGTPIALPGQIKYHPNPDHLNWHLNNRFLA